MRFFFITFIISLIFALKSNAQFLENDFLYGNAGISAGNYSGLEGGINYIKDEEISIHLNYFYRSNAAKNKPEDYSSGFLGSSSVYNQHHSFIASAGYVMPLNTSKTVRLILKGGAGLRWSRIASNYQPYYTGSTWFSGKYYSYDYENRYTVELTMNPALEFALARGYGLSISPVVSIGSGRTFFGASLNNLFGKVRARSKVSN